MTRAQDPGASTSGLSSELRQACLDEAWTRYRQRDFEICEALSRSLVAVDLTSTPYRTLLAASLFRLGRAGEAVAEIDDLLAWQPADEDLLELRAVLLGN
jgi:cytochrome c-type biogenesis protein CcmH/NrfG